MKTSLSTFIFCCSLAVSLCFAQTDADIEKYIQQLGHEDYTVREYAEQQIVRAGSRSIPFLKKALESGDAEISWRAETLLEEIQQKLKDPQKKKESVVTPPKSETEESEPILEEPEIDTLLEEIDVPKTRQFYTSSISIIQNGKMFQVNGRSDGSFKVRTEEVLSNGQKEIKETTYESEADFSSGNPELYKKYKKASEGFSFERITPRIKKQPPSSFGFGSQDSQFGSEDFADIADILQELLGNNGEMDFQRLLQKDSTQRLLEKALGSFVEDDPQLKQMLEMQKEMMKQFGGGGGGFQEEDMLEMQKEMMKQFGFDLDIFGNDSATPEKKTAPPKKKAPKVKVKVKKETPEDSQNQVFEETMEAHSFKGLELAPMTEALKNHLSHRGVVVVKAEGKAQEAGLLPYDLILSINGSPTSTPEEAVKALSRLESGTTVTIQLIRKMKEITLSFEY